MTDTSNATTGREPTDLTAILAHMQDQLDDLAAAVEQQQRQLDELRAADARPTSR